MRPIDWAANFGSINILEYLIRLGLDIYKNNDSGRGVLYYVVKEGRIQAVRFLIHCGCNPFTIDGTGKSAYDMAKQLKKYKILKLFSSYRSKFNIHIQQLNNNTTADIESSTPPTQRQNLNDFNENLFNPDFPAIPERFTYPDIPQIPDIFREITERMSLRNRVNDSVVEGKSEVNQNTNTASLPSATSTHEIDTKRGIDTVTYIKPRQSCLYSKSASSDKRHSYAIARINHTNWFAVFINFIIFGAILILTMCIPYYAWLGLLFLLFSLYRFVNNF